VRYSSRSSNQPSGADPVNNVRSRREPCGICSARCGLGCEVLSSVAAGCEQFGECFGELVAVFVADIKSAVQRRIEGKQGYSRWRGVWRGEGGCDPGGDSGRSHGQSDRDGTPTPRTDRVRVRDANQYGGSLFTLGLVFVTVVW
jgi:hypothetical protein